MKLYDPIWISIERDAYGDLPVISYTERDGSIKYVPEDSLIDKGESCPFCGSSDVSLSYSIQNNREQTRHYYIECHICASVGPETLKELLAWELWRNRKHGNGMS